MAMHWLSRGASGRRSRSRGGGGGGCGRGPLLLLIQLLHSVLLLFSQWPAAGEAVHSRRPSSQAHGGGAIILQPSTYPPSSTLLASAAASSSSAGGGGGGHRGQYLQRGSGGPPAHVHSSEEASSSSASFASSEAEMAVDMPANARPAVSSQSPGMPTTAELEAEGLLPRVNSYIPSNCSTCRMRQEIRNLSLQNIKDEIITKLGMKTVPNITGRILPKIPALHHLLDIYGMQGDDPLSGGGGGGERMFIPGPVILDEEDDFHARTDRVIAFAQPHPRLRHANKGVDIQYFRFSDKTTRNKVMRAHLWIYAKSWGGGDGEGGTGGGDVTVTVYRVREARGGGDSPQLSLIHSSKEREPLPGRGRWITIDIRRLVVEWFKYPRENLGLVAQVYDSDRHQLVVMDPEEDGGGYIPFVEVHTTDGRKHRTKRTIGLNCIENSRENRCCRYPLTVDFEEFGWDWIIAPKRYEANYCSGECPFVFLQKYPHTHIVQQANPGGTAGPCCAPRKMSSISMLYFDNEFNIIHSLLPGMVVDRCGCS